MSWMSTVGYREKEGSYDGSRNFYSFQGSSNRGAGNTQNVGSRRGVEGHSFGLSQRQIQTAQVSTVQLIVDKGIKEASGVFHAAVGLGGMLCASGVVAYGCSESEKDPVCSTAKKIAFLVIVPFIAIGSFLVLVKGLRSHSGVGLHPKSPISDFPIQRAALQAMLPSFNPKDPMSTPLMEAAFLGDLEVIYRWQKQGEYLEARDSEGRTALHWAAIGQQQRAIELLWYFGCNFNTLDQNSYGPVHYVKSDALKMLCHKLTNAKNRFSHESPIYLFYPPETLVYKGGGPKGIAYIGMQAVLEEQQLLREVKRVAGTSAGAITATLVAAGYKAIELQKILSNKDLKDFLDHEYQTEQKLITGVFSLWQKGGDATLNDLLSSLQAMAQWTTTSPKRPGFTGVLKQMAHRGGVCKGKQFLTWMDGLIKKKTGISHCTFGEYRALIQKGMDLKHIFVFATRIDTDEGVVCFNSQDEKWDNVIISHAVRASMSIPLVFTPHVLHIKTNKGKIQKNESLGIFIDGGVIENLPIERFDQECFMTTNPPSTHIRQNHQTLAFNLINPSKGDDYTDLASSDMGQVILALISVIKNAEEYRQKGNANHKQRIIPIDNQGVGLLSGFFATHETKQQLVNSGKRAACLFLDEQQRLAADHREHDPRQLLTILSHFMEPVYVNREESIDEPVVEDVGGGSGSDEEEITSSDQLETKLFDVPVSEKAAETALIGITNTPEEKIASSSQLTKKLFKAS